MNAVLAFIADGGRAIIVIVAMLTLHHCLGIYDGRAVREVASVGIPWI